MQKIFMQNGGAKKFEVKNWIKENSGKFEVTKNNNYSIIKRI